MEKLIIKRNIFIASSLGILLIILTYFFLFNSNKESEKYFDIYLANLYNEDTKGIDQKMEYLSNISDPNVSFFADLNLASIENLDKYEKLERDIILLKKAIQISAQGQKEVMKAIKPEMSEREVQGIHQLVYKKYGAAHEGYPSIVGAGDNACVLHYITNNKTDIKNQLILMDLGAEYNGYTADITRTIPVSGVFTAEQRELYKIVYDSQEAGISAAKKGASFKDISNACYNVVKEGLLKLGIIKKPEEFRRYLPHGVTHHIGLDVHDPGLYENLSPNMVITVEPGIYIPKDSPCDSKWWGIGIRIEDDILITDNGNVNLSKDAPRKWDEIEKLMKEKSALDDFELPPLKIN